MLMTKEWRMWTILIFVVFLAACSGQRKMMPTPSVHVTEGPGLYENLPAEFQKTAVPVFYVTDRAPERDEKGKMGYGYQRSASLAFGRALRVYPTPLPSPYHMYAAHSRYESSMVCRTLVSQ